MPAARVPLTERFWAKVQKTSECWLWTGARMKDGYGHIKVDGRMVRAHRLSYEMVNGPIPEGLDLDHLCRVRHCVRPDHLEPVTRWENGKRGVGWMAQQARKTHCDHGHPFDESNTYVGPRGGRACRRCNADAVARYRARRSAS